MGCSADRECEGLIGLHHSDEVVKFPVNLLVVDHEFLVPDLDTTHTSETKLFPLKGAGLGVWGHGPQWQLINLSEVHFYNCSQDQISMAISNDQP